MKKKQHDIYFYKKTDCSDGCSYNFVHTVTISSIIFMALNMSESSISSENVEVFALKFTSVNVSYVII